MLHVTVQKVLYEKIEKKRIFMNVLYHINKSEKLYLNTVKKNQKNLRIQLIYNLTPIRESWKKNPKAGKWVSVILGKKTSQNSKNRFLGNE